jgi:hypothetical protein
VHTLWVWDALGTVRVWGTGVRDSDGMNLIRVSRKQTNGILGFGRDHSFSST